MLDSPGVDTWLAQLLLARGRLAHDVLERQLLAVRGRRATGGVTLARALDSSGLVSQAELLELLTELGMGEDGSSEAPDPAPVPANEIGGYRLLSQLGAGGMATVYLAEHTQSGARRALKVLSCPDPELMIRFQREGQAQAAIDAHPAIARVFSAGVDRQRPFLVMELVEGGDLDSRLRSGPLEIEHARRLVAQLADAVHHAHTHGVLHRDLKPANVLLTPQGDPKLVDFGLARVAWAGSMTASGALMGTPSYMAPEQANPSLGGADARTDVYGLGAILYHSLAGRAPFSGTSMFAILAQVIHDAPTPLTKLRPETPPGLAAVCLKALAKRPEDRFATAAELAEALEIPSSEDRDPRKTRRVALGVAVACALGAAGFWLTRSDAPPKPSEAEVIDTVIDTSKPPPTDEQADAVAEVRRLFADGKSRDAKERFLALRQPPMDLRRRFALSDVARRLDGVSQDVAAAAAGLKTNESSALVRAFLAQRQVWTATRAPLAGLTGDFFPARRASLADSTFTGAVRLVTSGRFSSANVEEIQQRLRLIHTLDPARAYTADQIIQFVPAYPVSDAGLEATTSLAEILSDLAPDNEQVHQQLASWVATHTSPEARHRLLRVVDRAVASASTEANQHHARFYRVLCLYGMGERNGPGDDVILERGRREATELLALDLPPDLRAQTLELRGRIHLKGRSHSFAIRDLSASLALIDSGRVRFYRSGELIRTGRNEEALSDLVAFLESRPDSERDHFAAVANVWDLDRQHPKLLRFVRALVANRAHAPGWHMRLALLEFEANAPGLANAALDRALGALSGFENERRTVVARVQAMRRPLTQARDEPDPAKAATLLRSLVEDLDSMRTPGGRP